jgi:hypothetical protein
MPKNNPGEPNLAYDFGQDFDYSLWVPGTRIDLVNVPWNNDYRDVTRFADRAALDGDIDGLGPAGIQVNQLSYVKPNEPIRINIPHTRVNKYNYLRATNPLQPIDGDEVKNYYYFILGSKYVAPNTTEITIQLDVWQTYIYDIAIGNCYVERGHIGIANYNNLNNYGRDYLTVPEGIDTGSDLRIIDHHKHIIMTARDQSGPVYEPGNYNIVVISTVQLDSDPGTVAEPKLRSAWGSEGLGMPGGASVYGWQSQNNFTNWLLSMTDKPWHTQGIISASIVPNLNRYYDGGEIVWNSDPDEPTKLEYEGPHKVTHNMMSDFRGVIRNALPAKYQHLSKFLTSPYCVIELTTLTGNPITLKPELWQNTDAYVREVANVIPPSAKYVFYPDRYNGPGSDNDGGEGFDHATAIVNPPTMSVVNNMGISYLASHNFSLGWARDSAGWAQQRALHAAQNTYDNTKGQVSANAALTRTGIEADVAQTNNQNDSMGNQAFVGTIGGMLSGGAGGAGFGGGVKGGIAGALSAGIQGVTNQGQTLIQIGANTEALNIRNTAALASRDINARNTIAILDSNNDLAQFAAKGDYANALAGINAQVNDTNMIQPSVSGQQGGDVLNFLNQEFGIHMRVKLIDVSAIRRIGDFWLRYGYSVQSFIRIPADFKVMTKFSYWKLQETYIIAGGMPESFKQAIRGIFEKGVTVWVSPSDIGNVDMGSNVPIGGISY